MPLTLLLLALLAGEPGWLPRLQSFLEHHPSLRVPFTEVIHRPHEVDTIEGWLWIQRPDRVRVETSEMIWVQQGTQGLMKDLTTGQTSRFRSLGASPLALWTADSLQALFLWQETDTALVLVPRQNPADTVWLVLNPHTGAPLRLGYRSAQQRLVFRFGSWTAESLPDSLFRTP